MSHVWMRNAQELRHGAGEIVRCDVAMVDNANLMSETAANVASHAPPTSPTTEAVHHSRWR